MQPEVRESVRNPLAPDALPPLASQKLYSVFLSGNGPLVAVQDITEG